jgi:hypothetical protein
MEHRDTSKVWYGFFEELQPFTGCFSGKVCDTGDVAAGTGKALN